MAVVLSSSGGRQGLQHFVSIGKRGALLSMMKPPATIFLVVRFRVKKDCVTEARELFAKHEREGGEDAGNLEFRVFQDSDDETRFTSFEAWAHQEAIDKHDATEHHAEFLKNLAAIQAQEKEVQTLTALAH